MIIILSSCKKDCKEYISSGVYIKINEDKYEVTKAKLFTGTDSLKNEKYYNFELIAYDTDCTNFIELDFYTNVSHTNPLNEELQIIDDNAISINKVYSRIYFNSLDKSCTTCSYFSKGTSGYINISDKGKGLYYIDLNANYTDINYRFKERIQFDD